MDRFSMGGERERKRERETNSIFINNRVCAFGERELSRNDCNLARLRDGGGRNIRKLVVCGKERKKERKRIMTAVPGSDGR